MKGDSDGPWPGCASCKVMVSLGSGLLRAAVAYFMWSSGAVLVLVLS